MRQSPRTKLHARADSISREIDEMNKFEEGDLDGKDAHNYDNEDNL